MKLATFSSAADQRVGAVIDGGRRIVDLSRAFPDMLALIEAGDAGRATAEEIVADPPPDAIVDLAAVRLGAPLPCPPQIRDFLCFEEHLRNSFAQAERMTGRSPASTDLIVPGTIRLKFKSPGPNRLPQRVTQTGVP